MAVDVIDYSACKNPRVKYDVVKNKTTTLVQYNYFTTNILDIDKEIRKDYTMIDSFVVHMCLEGEMSILSDGSLTEITKGETVMIPASLKQLSLQPKTNCKLLEVYI